MGFEAKSSRLSAILPEEDGIIARFYETNGQADSVKISFPFRVARAQAIDLMGNPLPDALAIEGDAVRVSVQPVVCHEQRRAAVLLLYAAHRAGAYGEYLSHIILRFGSWICVP